MKSEVLTKRRKKRKEENLREKIIIRSLRLKEEKRNINKGKIELNLKEKKEREKKN